MSELMLRAMFGKIGEGHLRQVLVVEVLVLIAPPLLPEPLLGLLQVEPALGDLGLKVGVGVGVEIPLAQPRVERVVHVSRHPVAQRRRAALDDAAMPHRIDLVA